MPPSGYASLPRVLSVSQVTRYLKELLEIDDILQGIWVQGEVSDCKTYPSGHCYFTLKDSSSQLLCVFFKHARLRSSALELRNGMALAVNGRVSFYERKRPLPPQPAVIGIVTSLQAAALRDILRVLRTRYPLARVILSPAPVQGVEAPAAIAAALDLLNAHGEADVIIVGRGGGSIEELWAFNEEVVARAIARSRIPVISGVGHEVDFTIADFVADHRASTPTAAAAAAVPDIADWQDDILAKQQTLIELIQERLEDLGADLEHVQRDLQRASPRYQLESRQQQLDDLTALLQTRMQYILSLRRERLRGASLRLHSLSPLLTIARGYAVVRREPDHALVTSVQQVKPRDELTIQVTDGHIHVSVHS